jgi:hypothetical protein
MGAKHILFFINCGGRDIFNLVLIFNIIIKRFMNIAIKHCINLRINERILMEESKIEMMIQGHEMWLEDLDPQAIHQEYLTRFQGLDYDLGEQGVFVYPPLG